MLKRIFSSDLQFLHITALGLVLLTSISGLAQRDENTKQYLKQFFSSETEAARLMDAPVPKYNSKGQVIKARSQFSASDIKDKKFIAIKNKKRDSIFKLDSKGNKVFVRDLLSGKSAMEYNDQPEDLVDNADAVVRNILQMDKNLKSARLKEAPWSDDYWALYSGTTAKRYNDPLFPGSSDWKENADYILKNPVVEIKLLSPAEKYDLLVNDSKKTYTTTQLEEGQSYYESSGTVEPWMGICHGWAPAAYVMPRPTGTVTALAADGKTEILFYPSDIKALISSLWASANVPSRFIGGRCNVKDPKKNSAGRVIDQDCFDNNPASWHMAVVNQLGISKRSFVLDVTFDFEVWNQPVLAYSFSYFNPVTQDLSEDISEAMIDIAEFKKDPFKKFRNSGATKIVGIAMDVEYVVETSPSNAEEDSENFDQTQYVRYMYDLELNDDGDILGGEWYTNQHPDFLWTPAPDARAKTFADRPGLSAWDANTEALPADLAKAGQQAARTRMPLAAIVEALIEASRR